MLLTHQTTVIRAQITRGTVSPGISITMLEDTFMTAGGGYLLPFTSIATIAAWRIIDQGLGRGQ